MGGQPDDFISDHKRVGGLPDDDRGPGAVPVGGARGGALDPTSGTGTAGAGGVGPMGDRGITGEGGILEQESPAGDKDRDRLAGGLGTPEDDAGGQGRP